MIVVVTRYWLAVCMALLTTFGLFMLMQDLIAEGNAGYKEVKRMRVVDFVRLRRESVVKEKKRERPKRPNATEQPEAPALDLPQPGATVTNVPAMEIAAPAADFDFKIRRTGPQLGPAPSTSDTDELPMVRVKPQYPRVALLDGVEGWVRVRFDVSPSGRVTNPVIIAAKPINVFEQSVLHAVKRWRYRPKIVNGVAVKRKGIAVKIPFKISD